MKFDYSLDFKEINFREQPELYRIGIGEQGVLLVEPYKSEILPYWRFKTPKIAEESSEKIYQLFLNYKDQDDFVGMDMARKFLQMGFTRARRYANHKTGRKWSEGRSKELPDDVDPLKAESAKIFYAKYLKAKTDPDYLLLMKKHRELYDPLTGKREKAYPPTNYI
jgi:hypothetical protein